jgi:hypothetical protein
MKVAFARGKKMSMELTCQFFIFSNERNECEDMAAIFGVASLLPT